MGKLLAVMQKIRAQSAWVTFSCVPLNGYCRQKCLEFQRDDTGQNKSSKCFGFEQSYDD